MKQAEMTVLRFQCEDVIATSAPASALHYRFSGLGSNDTADEAGLVPLKIEWNEQDVTDTYNNASYSIAGVIDTLTIPEAEEKTWESLANDYGIFNGDYDLEGNLFSKVGF